MCTSDGGSPTSGSIQRPAALTKFVDVSTMVDTDNGFVDRAVFTDQSIYQQELRRIFAPSWLFLGHTSQISKPGEFLTTYMGEDPVIV